MAEPGSFVPSHNMATMCPMRTVDPISRLARNCQISRSAGDKDLVCKPLAKVLYLFCGREAHVRENIVTAILIGWLALSLGVDAVAEESPVEKALAVPGAKVTRLVTAAKEPFPKEFADSAFRSFNPFHA